MTNCREKCSLVFCCGFHVKRVMTMDEDRAQWMADCWEDLDLMVENLKNGMNSSLSSSRIPKSQVLLIEMLQSLG